LSKSTSLPRQFRLSVNVTPIPQANDEDAQSPILNIADHPAVADTVTPKTSQRANQGLACVSGVFESGDAFIHGRFQ
jgi:hypothetical protein